MIAKETLLLLSPLIFGYDSGYNNKPIGGDNPYYACTKCGISDPQINGSVFNHGRGCKYALRRVKECLGDEYSTDDAKKIIGILSDRDEYEQHKKNLGVRLGNIIAGETGVPQKLATELLNYTSGDYVGLYNSLKSITNRKLRKKLPEQKPYDILSRYYKKELANTQPDISFKDLF